MVFAPIVTFLPSTTFAAIDALVSILESACGLAIKSPFAKSCESRANAKCGLSTIRGCIWFGTLSFMDSLINTAPALESCKP